MSTDVYTLGQAARFLGRDLEDVTRLVESDQIPFTQAADGEPLISGRDLTRYAFASFGRG